MAITIQRLEHEATGALFDGALDLRRVLTAEIDPAVDPDTEAMFRARITGTPTFEETSLVASVDDVVIGMAGVETVHLENNTDKAEMQIEVHPEHRRQGIGTALARAVFELALSKGRTSIIGINVSSAEGRGFWESLGAEEKLIERESRLWLAEVDLALMQDWVSKRIMRAGDYRLEHFRGETPQSLLPAMVHLLGVMNDAPLDDLDWEDDVWSEADVLELDRVVRERGSERWTTVAFGPNDEPAGLTSLSIRPHKPRFALQGNTAVDPVHRNRGIGRWLKADMWFRLRADAPQAIAIDTDNAASNDPMLAINEAMGFAPLMEWSIFQGNTVEMQARIGA